MNTIRQNTIANFFGRVLGVVSVYLFIPFYLKFLGIEAYGLVGFYSTLIGVLAFADLGLTATLSREMARLSVLENSADEMANLLRTYETIYLYISLAVSLLIWLFAPLIAGRWLRASALTPSAMTSAIRLMGIAISLQLPAGLYAGGLMGLQKQVLSNALQIAWGGLRGLGTILILWLYSQTIFAFAFCQLCSNLAYCFAVRWTLRRTLPSTKSKPHFSRLALRHTWKYAMSMAGTTFLSTILMQTDKLVISKILPLEMFGYYTLAGSLAQVPIILAAPIGVAMFPRLTGLVSLSDKDTLTRIYHKACGLVSVAVIPAALTLALNKGDFIFAWTGSVVATQKAGLVASLLLGGQIMQALTVVPFYLALAYGHTKLILQVQIISIIFITPLLVFLIINYGIVGGGLSWLIMNLCTIPFYMYFLHRRFLYGEFWRWLLQDIGRPLLVTIFVIVLGRSFLPSAGSRLMTFGLLGLVWSISAAAASFTIPVVRKEIFQKTRKLFGVS